MQNEIDEASTSANLLDLKTASDFGSQTFSLLYPKLSSSLYSTSSVDDILTCESEKLSNIASNSSSQPVTHSYNLRSRPIQTSSPSSTRSTPSSISAILRQHAQPNSSTSENLPSSLSDIPISLRPSSGMESSFTVHSYPRSTPLIGDQESVFSLSTSNSNDLRSSISYARR